MATGTRRKMEETTQAQGNLESESGGLQTQDRSPEGTESTSRLDRIQRENVKNYRRIAGGANPKKLARGLGIFSIGLGLTEFLAPEKVANLIGVRRSNTLLIRLFGLREIASGVAIFVQGRRPRQAVWSRVAGDALDLAALGAAFNSRRSNRAKLAFATANVVAVSALDVKCAKQLSDSSYESYGVPSRSDRSAAIKSLIINRPPEELYQAWRQFENLPRFMKQLESVTATSPTRSHWVAIGPGGRRVEWDAEITDDRPNEHIAWRSVRGDVGHSGFVRFERAPGNRGTIVKIKLHYKLPGGKFGAGLAKLFGQDPSQRAKQALRHFKQLMETGEVVVSESTLHGNDLLSQRPAQPEGDSSRERRFDYGRRRERGSMQRMEENYAS
jgi:uncharacterized membrane protein